MKTKSQIGGKVDLCMVFAAESFPAHMISDLKMVLNAQYVVGGVSSEILCNKEICKDGLAIVCFDSESTRGFRMNQTQERPRIEIEKALRAASYKKFSRQGLVFGLMPRVCDEDDFIAAVGTVFGTSFSCTGVYPYNRVKPYTALFDEETITDSVVGGFIGGQEASVVVGSTHGFKPIGVPFKFKRVQGQRVFDLDTGEYAYHIYQHYFQDKIHHLESNEEEMQRFFSIYPLGFKNDDLSDYSIAVPEKVLVDGSLVLRGEVHTNRFVRLMFSTPSLTLESTKLLLSRLRPRLKKIQLAVVVESINRLRLLYPEAYRDLWAIGEELGPDVPVVGMISDYHVATTGKEYTLPQHIVNSGLTIMLVGEP